MWNRKLSTQSEILYICFMCSCGLTDMLFWLLSGFTKKTNSVVFIVSKDFTDNESIVQNFPTNDKILIMINTLRRVILLVVV